MKEFVMFKTELGSMIVPVDQIGVITTHKVNLNEKAGGPARWEARPEQSLVRVICIGLDVVVDASTEEIANWLVDLGHTLSVPELPEDAKTVEAYREAIAGKINNKAGRSVLLETPLDECGDCIKARSIGQDKCIRHLFPTNHDRDVDEALQEFADGFGNGDGKPRNTAFVTKDTPPRWAQ